MTSSTVDLVMVVARAAILIIAALGGILSIYLGWRLYRDGVVSAVQGEASHGSKWRIRLASAGPGAFLVAFGMGLLAWLVAHPVQFDDSDSLQVPRSTVAHLPTNYPPAGFPLALIRIQDRRQAAPTDAQQFVCFVRIRKRVFLNGGELNPERISASLALARSYLVQAERTGADPRTSAQIDDAIDTIDELRNSTGEWPLGR